MLLVFRIQQVECLALEQTQLHSGLDEGFGALVNSGPLFDAPSRAGCVV